MLVDLELDSFACPVIGNARWTKGEDYVLAREAGQIDVVWRLALLKQRRGINRGMLNPLVRLPGLNRDMWRCTPAGYGMYPWKMVYVEPLSWEEAKYE